MIGNSFTHIKTRVRSSSTISQSVSALDLSAKDKSAKTPRRLSIPTKSAFSPHQASVGSITPVSATGARRSSIQQKSDTQLSDVSKSSCRLYYVSYWLTQIKLAESASKHSVSLGFFKLALELGCEPLQRIREELKSYVHKHNLLAELGEATKDLLQRYNILEEESEHLKLSEDSSKLQENGSTASNQNIRSSCALTGSGNQKPKSLISKALTVSEAKEVQRVPVAKEKPSSIKNPGHFVAVKDANVNNAQKKSLKPSRVDSNRSNAKVKSLTTEALSKKGDLVDPALTGEAAIEDRDILEDKENMDSQSINGAVLKEDVQT
ncbi:uncharacterized protein A4U43_C01F23070 [Asparagus officinalis]|uniref:Uncharacterized protein n=1 Tax=Asparagus officinalis TaxID=4686 RepID=A0A5P1FRF6_ASPOF|nr:uncharacterized protein A4U43_C01F23070 [Asparagus officinalis]